MDQEGYSYDGEFCAGMKEGSFQITMGELNFVAYYINDELDDE